MMFFLLLLIGGFLVGISSGLLGIGGGVLLVPLLVYGFKLDMHVAIGTSLVVIIPTAIASGFVHFNNGNVSLKHVVWLVVFSTLGGIVGSSFSSDISSVVLKRIFAVVLLLIVLKMFFGK